MPRIVAEADRKGRRPYLIITVIPGDKAEDIWDDLTRAERLTVAFPPGIFGSP